MATRSRRGGGGIVDAVRVDLDRLHGAWMEIVFPRQRGRGHSVMGKWKPKTTPQKVAYHGWSVLGALGLLVVYPLTVFGFATRYYAAKLDSTATRLGVAGVVGLSVVVWGALTVVAHLQLPYEAFLAVAAASVVATISAALGVGFSRIGGRTTTVLLGYPFSLTAIFLPPVVAALFVPTLQAAIFDPSDALAMWILDTFLYVGGLNDWLRETFSLTDRFLFVEGEGLAVMWGGFSFLLGWFLGALVALANLVRPSP